MRPGDPVLVRSVIAERPWPAGWEHWRPDPSWTPLGLRDGWEAA